MAEATPQQIANAAQVLGYAMAGRQQMVEDGQTGGIFFEVANNMIGYFEQLLDEYGVNVSELPQTQVEAEHAKKEKRAAAKAKREAKRAAAAE